MRARASRVADDLGEHVAQAARRRRLGQLDDEARDRRPGAAARTQPQPTAEREPDERDRLGEPQPPLERAVYER